MAQHGPVDPQIYGMAQHGISWHGKSWHGPARRILAPKNIGETWHENHLDLWDFLNLEQHLKFFICARSPHPSHSHNFDIYEKIDLEQLKVNTNKPNLAQVIDSFDLERGFPRLSPGATRGFVVDV